MKFNKILFALCPLLLISIELEAIQRLVTLTESAPNDSIYPQFMQRESHRPEDIGHFENDNISPSVTKILRDGQLLIIRDEKTYTVTGQEVK